MKLHYEIWEDIRIQKIVVTVVAVVVSGLQGSDFNLL